jgi:hypothetical protein
MKTLRVSNIPDAMDADELRLKFSGSGKVLDVRISGEGRKRIGLVDMDDRDAQNALKQLNGKKATDHDVPLTVEFADNAREDLKEQELGKTASQSKAL